MTCSRCSSIHYQMIPKIRRTGARPRRILLHFRYGTNAQCNSQGLQLIQRSVYSFAVYVGSSIYSPTIPAVMEAFDIGQVPAPLGLALYVLACKKRHLLVPHGGSRSNVLLRRWNRTDGILAIERVSRQTQPSSLNFNSRFTNISLENSSFGSKSGLHCYIRCFCSSVHPNGGGR